MREGRGGGASRDRDDGERERVVVRASENSVCGDNGRSASLCVAEGRGEKTAACQKGGRGQGGKERYPTLTYQKHEMRNKVRRKKDKKRGTRARNVETKKREGGRGGQEERSTEEKEGGRRSKIEEEKNA